MSFICYDFQCSLCNEVHELFISRNEIGDAQECPSCKNGLTMLKLISSPMVAKASYRDGYKRPDMQKLKEAAKLESQMYSAPREERGAFKKEIDKLTKIPKG